MTANVKKLSVALGGNPNSGKTTLFNAITGARQHVGNYPGVTVEKKEGYLVREGTELHIVDLPGTYSLTAYSEDELVARNFLTESKPEVVIDIVDASNLERNLYLTIQLLELGLPVCIALNMIDAAQKNGVTIDAQKLSSLMGIPVVPTIARSGKGKEEVIQEAINLATQQSSSRKLSISYGQDLDETLIDMETIISGSEFLTRAYPARWVAIKYLESDHQVIRKGELENAEVSETLQSIVSKTSQHVKATLDTYPEALIADYRYGYISSLLKQNVVSHTYDHNRLQISDRVDKIVTNRVLGPVIMLAVVFCLYEFTFTYSAIPIGWFESFFGWLSGFASEVLADGLLKSLIVSGVIDGVGGVLGFVPLIMFMFFGISILEDSGYLARIAYMLDRVFSMFGLHGNSVMAFMVSGGIAGGCAVPGVMAARTLKSPREKLATLLTVPFMNCGAKLPVMALLVGAFFGKNEAMMMMLITLIAWSGALIVSKILRLTVISGPPTPFVMELPPYRLPTLRGLFTHTWERTWQYIKKAGTIILGISIILWAMMIFPGLNQSQINEMDARRATIMASVAPALVEEISLLDEDENRTLSDKAATLNSELERIDRLRAEMALKNSIAGRIGQSMEGVSRLAGFDWRTSIALIGGFAAKEVVVSTLGTAYSMGKIDPEDTDSLGDTLKKAPGWSPLVALCLILFTIFYAPCFVTVVAISREAGSWRWGAFSVIFNTTLAFGVAVSVYQIGTLFGFLGA